MPAIATARRVRLTIAVICKKKHDKIIMSWTDNMTLLEYSKYTPCQEIFQAVCDELGKHYVAKGYKYSRSQPKLKIEKSDIKLEVAFCSSRSNTPGDWSVFWNFTELLF